MLSHDITTSPDNLGCPNLHSVRRAAEHMSIDTTDLICMGHIAHIIRTRMLQTAVAHRSPGPHHMLSILERCLRKHARAERDVCQHIAPSGRRFMGANMEHGRYLGYSAAHRAMHGMLRGDSIRQRSRSLGTPSS